MSADETDETDGTAGGETAAGGADGTAADDPAGVASEDPLLSIEDLEVHFSPGGMLRSRLTDRTIRAVDGVSLDLAENDIVVLVGESGCGKTTLGKAAVGLQRPTGGSVRYRGHDIWNDAANDDSDIDEEAVNRALQIIHQDPESALNSSRRVKAILSDPLKKWRTELGPEERMQTIYRYLEYVDVTPAEDYAERFPHQLSGGEKQRIVLGRALLTNPDVIMADEAISALDVSLRVDMMDLIVELQDLFDTAYLFISHDLANARYLAKRTGGRIAIMYLGEIVEIGPPDDILTNPTHPYTEVLRWSTPTVDPDVARETIENEPPVRRIDVPDPENPPSGCTFHTRCPEAREACTQEHPDLYDAEGNVQARCFRALDNHEYWNSPELEDEESAEAAAEPSD